MNRTVHVSSKTHFFFFSWFQSVHKSQNIGVRHGTSSISFWEMGVILVNMTSRFFFGLLIGTWPGRYLVIEPTSFKKEAEEMALIFAIDVTTINDLSLRTYCVVMNCPECIWIADCRQAGFSKGQAGLWISWKGDVWWKQWWKWWDWRCVERTLVFDWGVLQLSSDLTEIHISPAT